MKRVYKDNSSINIKLYSRHSRFLRIPIRPLLQLSYTNINTGLDVHDNSTSNPRLALVTFENADYFQSLPARWVCTCLKFCLRLCSLNWSKMCMETHPLTYLCANPTSDLSWFKSHTDTVICEFLYLKPTHPSGRPAAVTVSCVADVPQTVCVDNENVMFLLGLYNWSRDTPSMVNLSMVKFHCGLIGNRRVLLPSRAPLFSPP